LRECAANTGASCGIAITGIAGPDGGTADKPVGTVFVGLAHPGGILVKKLQLHGDRAMIRRRASLQALDLLRRILLEARRL
jgi:nicotinamide-nucleotide amidase